jgi:hypothetical protein
MNQRVRIVCELGMCALSGLAVFVNIIPARIGIPLAVAGFLFTCADLAFRIHDRNLRDDASSLDLHR